MMTGITYEVNKMTLETNLLKKLLEDDWVLVTYDIKGRHYSDEVAREARIRKERRQGATAEEALETVSCDKRNLFRDKLERLGAVKQNDSVYFVPAKLASKREELIETLKFWAGQYGVDIKAVGVSIDDQEQVETLSNQYTKNLKDLLKEMNDNLKESWKKIKDLEDDVAKDPKKKLTGAYRIIEGVSTEFTDVQALINRWGNEDDQWDLDSLKYKVIQLIQRWNSIRKSRKLDEQAFDLKDKGIRK